MLLLLGVVASGPTSVGEKAEEEKEGGAFGVEAEVGMKGGLGLVAELIEGSVGVRGCGCRCGEG